MSDLEKISDALRATHGRQVVKKEENNRRLQAIGPLLQVSEDDDPRYGLDYFLEGDYIRAYIRNPGGYDLFPAFFMHLETFRILAKQIEERT